MEGQDRQGHPGYSGTISRRLFQMQRDLGWSFFEALAKQNSCRLHHRPIREESSISASVR